MFYIEEVYEGHPCKVYFFKRWGTYEHPVKPLDPVSYAEALQRKGYCRAWMCESKGQDVFVFFEAVKNEIEPTTIAKPNSDAMEIVFYKYMQGSKGAEILAKDTINETSFLVSLPGNDSNLSLVNSSLAYSYEYQYAATGVLEKVIITDMEGNVKSLDY